jgi:hypothetical protein
MKLTGSAILALAALGALVLLYFRYGETVKRLVTVELNPANTENAINAGVVTPLVTAATGRDESLGGWLYDLTHPSVNAPITPGV